VIERLLPEAVICESARDDEGAHSLFPEEAALVAGAIAARQREFATARSCAHRALARLGLPPVPILRGARHEPLWPRGLVGSITHCRGYRAAAVTRRAELRAVAIDAEPDEKLPADAARYVLRVDERAALARAPGGTNWDRVLFSAKESVYKAWFPMTGRWLGFDEAVVTIDPGRGIFEAVLLADPPHPGLPRLSGRFLVADRLVLTAIAVPA